MYISAKSWLTCYFILFFFLWGIFLPFWSVWLDGKGVTAEQIGTLFSLGLLLRFVSNLVLLPRLKKASSVLQFICWLSLSVFLCLGVLVFEQSWWALAILTLLANFLLAPMIPLGDIIGIHLVKQLRLNYGQVRLWGSISFIIGSACVGWTIQRWGNETILWLILIFSLFIYLLSLIQLKPALDDEDTQTHRSNTSIWSLLKQSKVIYFLLTMGLIQGSHSAYYAFSALYWESEGISEFNIALLWGIGVFAEVLLMQFNDRLFKGWSIKQMTLLALTAALLRWVVFASTTDLTWLLLVQTCHAFTFALAHLAAMRFIALQCESQMVNYQTLYSSVALGLAMALLTYLSGWGFATQQGGVFLWMAIILLPAFICLWKWKADNELSDE